MLPEMIVVPQMVGGAQVKVIAAEAGLSLRRQQHFAINQTWTTPAGYKCNFWAWKYIALFISCAESRKNFQHTY